MADSYLVHNGVKGMKWGRRKAKAPAKRLAVSSDYQEFSRTSSKIKSSGTSSLSNRQLQANITRLNLEKQYKQLNPSEVQKGYGKVKAALGVAGTLTAAYAFVKSPLVQDVAKLMRRRGL